MAKKDTATVEVKAMNMKSKQMVAIENLEVFTMSNGRKAARGVASDDHETKVFKILSKAELEALGEA